MIELTQHDFWPECRPHPRYAAVGLLLGAGVVFTVGTQAHSEFGLVGQLIGLVGCLGITVPARVHRRVRTPLPGRRGDGHLVLITDGPGVRTLMARVRDPHAQLHRDISFTYRLVPAVVLPLAVLLIAGSVTGQGEISIGIFIGLLVGLALTLAWRPLHATWWAWRADGMILDPKTVSPALAAYAEVHGEYTVYVGVRPLAVRATLATHPELAANVTEVIKYLGGTLPPV